MSASVGTKLTMTIATNTHHPKWKAATRSFSEAGEPTMATKTATPIAIDAWRIMLTTPDPVAKADGGNAPPLTPINVG